MKTFLPNFVFKELSTYAAIIVIFVHNNVLDKNLECTCNPEDIDCSFYMAMPFFIIFILKLWSDKTFQRALKYTCPCTCNCCNWCTEKRCKFFCVLLYHIIKAAFIGLLWVVSVLIEGDWYVCCRNDQSEQQKQLACKDKKNITDKDQTRITELKNHSKVIGLSLLFSILLVAALMSSFGEKCCKKKSDRKRLYYKVILDEEKNVLKEILTTAAKKKLTEGVESKMHGEQWETCFDVAKELIENNTGPGAAGANQEQQQPEQQQPEQQQPEQQQPWQRREQQQQPQDGIPLRTVRPEVDPLLSASPGSSGEQ